MTTIALISVLTSIATTSVLFYLSRFLAKKDINREILRHEIYELRKLKDKIPNNDNEDDVAMQIWQRNIERQFKFLITTIEKSVLINEYEISKLNKSAAQALRRLDPQSLFMGIDNFTTEVIHSAVMTNFMPKKFTLLYQNKIFIWCRNKWLNIIRTIQSYL